MQRHVYPSPIPGGFDVTVLSAENEEDVAELEAMALLGLLPPSASIGSSYPGTREAHRVRKAGISWDAYVRAQLRHEHGYARS